MVIDYSSHLYDIKDRIDTSKERVSLGGFNTEELKSITIF